MVITWIWEGGIYCDYPIIDIVVVIYVQLLLVVRDKDNDKNLNIKEVKVELN